MGTSKNGAKKRPLRLDENDNPMLVVTSNLKLFCHENVDDQSEEGDVFTVKMRATGPFLSEFNARVFSLLQSSIQSARMEDRTTLLPEDVPTLEE